MSNAHWTCARKLNFLAAVMLEGPERAIAQTSPADLTEFGSDDPAWATICRELTEGDLSAVNEEHTALFCSNGTRYLVPYGTSWGGQHALVGLLSRLQRFYKAKGFDPCAAISREARSDLGHVGLVHDHVGVMFACEALLCEGANPSESKDFEKRFLGPWLPSFCDALKKNARTPFFKAVADLLRKPCEA